MDHVPGRLRTASSVRAATGAGGRGRGDGATAAGPPSGPVVTLGLQGGGAPLIAKGPAPDGRHAP